MTAKGMSLMHGGDCSVLDHRFVHTRGGTFTKQIVVVRAKSGHAWSACFLGHFAYRSQGSLAVCGTIWSANKVSFIGLLQ